MCVKWRGRPVFTPVVVVVAFAVLATPAYAAVRSKPRERRTAANLVALTTEAGDGSLESAASRASATGRTIAFSLIGLALSVTAVILVFRRDFKEAVGVLAIGVIAVLLASPVGLTVLQDTVSVLFGSG